MHQLEYITRSVKVVGVQWRHEEYLYMNIVYVQ